MSTRLLVPPTVPPPESLSLDGFGYDFRDIGDERGRSVAIFTAVCALIGIVGQLQEDLVEVRDTVREMKKNYFLSDEQRVAINEAHKKAKGLSDKSQEVLREIIEGRAESRAEGRPSVSE